MTGSLDRNKGGGGAPLDVTFTDVTASRVANTPYQNTTGKVMCVLVTVDMSTVALNDLVDNFLATDVDTSFSDNFYGEATLEQKGAQALRNIQSLFIIVPPNYYYKLITQINGTGIDNIVTWVEGEFTGVLASSDIKDGAVTTAKLADASVTDAKLDSAVKNLIGDPILRSIDYQNDVQFDVTEVQASPKVLAKWKVTGLKLNASTVSAVVTTLYSDIISLLKCDVNQISIAMEYSEDNEVSYTAINTANSPTVGAFDYGVQTSINDTIGSGTNDTLFIRLVAYINVGDTLGTIKTLSFKSLLFILKTATLTQLI